MNPNDNGSQNPEAGADNTAQNDDVQLGDDVLENLDDESKKKVQTLDAQRNHWKQNAIDPETGKKYKDLVAELKAGPKEDKTSDKNENKDKTSNDTKDNSELLQRLDKMSLQSAGVKEQDEVELANDFKKRTGMEMDEVIQDDIFQAKLEKLREEKKTDEAISNVKGGADTNSAKESFDYWDAKGRPPTPEEVPNAKSRRKIARQFIEKQKKGGVSFYNE